MGLDFDVDADVDVDVDVDVEVDFDAEIPALPVPSSTKAAIDRYDRSIDRPIESIDSIDSIIFRSFEEF